MAQIQTDEHFRLAAAQWLDDNSIQGATIDATGRKIFDNFNADITPLEAVLEAALDVALIDASRQQEIEQAYVAIADGNEYLKNQLISATPHNVTQLVSNIKPVVDGNTFLLRMVNNQIDLMSLANTWTAASVKNPATNPDRARYILAVESVIALLA